MRLVVIDMLRECMELTSAEVDMGHGVVRIHRMAHVC